jgi:hypothetical protein
MPARPCLRYRLASGQRRRAAAVGTTTIDGELREGRGVEPDVAVPFDVR